MSEKRLLQKVAANDMPSAAHMAGTGEKAPAAVKNPNRSPASGLDSGRSCDRMSEQRLLQKVAANDMPSAATWRSGWDSNPRALADNLISRGVKRLKPLISPHKTAQIVLKKPVKRAFFVSCYLCSYLYATSFFLSGHHLGTITELPLKSIRER